MAEFSATGMTEAERAAAIEAGRLLFSGPCDFFFGAQTLGQLPPPGLPEIAFAGRSNVGKSSLINGLTGRKALARASSQPGRTQQLNFFNLGDRLVLVDMPGYGFAKAAKAVKEDWQGLMFEYLRGRPSLARVMLLLDARVEIKQNDREAMTLLNRAAVVFQVVLTKCDAVGPRKLQDKCAEVAALVATHAAAHQEILVTSSESGLGMEELRTTLAGLGGPAAV